MSRAGSTASLVGMLDTRGMSEPRFDMQLKELENDSDLFSSSRLDCVVLTTSTGIMDHEKKDRNPQEDAWRNGPVVKSTS